MDEELDLDALQRLADSATPGPWSASVVRVEKDDDGQRRGAGVVRGANGGYVFMSANGPEILVADAEFIAAARSAVPALLDRGREAEAELEARIEDRDYWYRIATEAKDQRDAALATIAKVRELTDEVIVLHAGRYGTHFDDCYRFHVACFAVAVRERALGSVPSTNKKEDETK